MIAAIMQPYFFPYIGYFQLMKVVDQFIIYDDAQYMKGGWVNRNRIILKSKLTWLTLPVKRDSLSLSINQRYYLRDNGIERIKQQLHSAYAKASLFSEIYPFICNLLDFNNPNVSAFNENLLIVIAHKLRLGCNFVKSSGINKNPNLTGEARVIDLCKRLGVSHYINPIGGITLYDPIHFADAGLKLSFLRSTAQPTILNTVPVHLSVIDGLMHAGFNDYEALLSSFEMVD